MSTVYNTNNLIKFYTNLYAVNNKNDYFLQDMIDKWDDYKLEVQDDFITWIFPNLTKKYRSEFKKNPIVRSNVVKATLRMLLLYGFVIKDNTIKQVKPLNRQEKGRTIGLFSVKNYNRITRILKFLVDINMKYLSALFFLIICKAIKNNKNLLRTVIKNKSLKEWMSTQPFLKKYLSTTKFKRKPQENLSILQQQCKKKVRGLNYVSNSCYMDSTLISLFAIPNKVITSNILKKNLNDFKTIPKRWISCSDNINTDIERRKNIQVALNLITNSIRGLYNIKKCTMLRKFISQCPGTQPFHKGETQDAGEFLSYLFTLFQVDISETIRKTYGTNDKSKNPKWELIKTHIDKKSTPIIEVVSSTLIKIPKDYNITGFIKQTEYSNLDESNKWYPDKQKNPQISFIRKKETLKVKNSPYIVFNLLRTYGEPIFYNIKKSEKDNNQQFIGMSTKNIWKRLTVPEQITIKHKKLTLSAIVVHTGENHYVSNFKCADQWFWYDDRPGYSSHIIKHIGSYDKMIKTRPNPLSHGTLFFYT